MVLTATMSVGMAYQGVIEATLREVPEIVDDVVLLWSASATTRGSATRPRCRSHPRHVVEAFANATDGLFEAGAIGAGSGMTCLGWKGGIGTSSRFVDGHVLGALVLTNFGALERLCVNGSHVGRRFAELGRSGEREAPEGSCIVVIATDAPILPAQCQRVARRAGLGLARTGSDGSPRQWRDLPRVQHRLSLSARSAAVRSATTSCRTATSTGCSRRQSMRRRKQCSTACSGRRPRPVDTAVSPKHCRSTRCWACCDPVACRWSSPPTMSDTMSRRACGAESPRPATSCRFGPRSSPRRALRRARRSSRRWTTSSMRLLRVHDPPFVTVLQTAYQRWVDDGHLESPGVPYVTPYFFPPVAGQHGGVRRAWRGHDPGRDRVLRDGHHDVHR